MTRGLQIWPGERMTAFFRAIIKRDTALDDAAATRLALALGKPINRMLVNDGTDAVLQGPALAATMPAQTADSAAADVARNEDAEAHPPTSAPQVPASEPPAPFDPYVFSVMVVLSKAGKGGLAKRLAEIKKAEHLYALADAQHLGVERGLKRTEDIRKAIVAATERRLANRKAAAS